MVQNSPEINICMCGQVIFNRVPNTIQWEKSSTVVVGKLNIHIKKNGGETSLTIYKN